LQSAKISISFAEARVADLGRDETVFSWLSTLLQRNTHFFLIVVNLSGVNVAISSRYGLEAYLRTVGLVNPIHSEPEDRHPTIGVSKRDGGLRRQSIICHFAPNTSDLDNVQIEIAKLLSLPIAKGASASMQERAQNI
jgi:hypothetical protein